MSAEDAQELSLDLPAAHSASRMARHVVAKFAVERGMPKEAVETLELVTSELLSNAVDHGGGGAAMKEKDVEGGTRMKLHLSVVEGCWTLAVSDQGGGDPAEIAPYLDDSVLPDLEDERGRGFFLLVQMVDELRVVVSEDGQGLMFVASKKHVEPPR